MGFRPGSMGFRQAQGSDGHTGEFLVLRVHKREGVADLGLIGSDSVEYRIPLTALRVIREKVAGRIVPEN